MTQTDLFYKRTKLYYPGKFTFTILLKNNKFVMYDFLIREIIYNIISVE